MSFRPSSAELRGELVGRDREQNLLAESRRDAAAGHGHIVLVSGEAGIGKSSLLRQFESSVTSGRSIGALARCVEFVQTPLGPLRELLQKLERRAQAPHDAATRALVQRLTFERNAAPGDGFPTGTLFDFIDAALARLALRGTVVLMIEDIHWADRSTLGFLNYLADRIDKRRMMIVATYRSDEVGAVHPLLAEFAALLGKKSVTNVALDKFDERSCEALIQLLLPSSHDLDATTIVSIVRRSQGNPFFAEELLKHALGRAPGASEADLPLSIRGAVLSRAALLSEPQRKILLLAAVLGERFAVDRLVDVSGEGRDDVLSALERARALQLIEDRRNLPGELSFRHALTQEALYGELLAERVRPIHEAIAKELERQSDRAAVCVELAHHWERAGDPARSAAYAEVAGDQAFSIGAMADAVTYYERTLAHGKSGGERASLHHKIGLALGSLGNLNAGIARLRRAGDLYWEAGDFEGFAKNASALGAQLYNTGDTAAATDVYRRTVEALVPKLPAAALDLLRARIAYNCVAALDLDSALTLLAGISEPIADPVAATMVNVARFKISAMRGDVAQWRNDGRRALDAASRVADDGSQLAHAHCQIALDAVGLGETDVAREHFRAAMPSHRARYLSERALACAASSFENTLRGDFATAATLLDEARRATEQSYAILVHVRSAQFLLGICSGDDSRLRHDDSESFLHYGVAHGMKLAIGLLGGPYAWALGLRGETEAAANWIHRIAGVLPGPHRFMPAYLAAAQFGRKGDVATMRRQLSEAASRPADRVNTATLALFDAFTAERSIAPADRRARGLDAAAGFGAIGWPWLAARGYEAAGEIARALETYRALGALRDLRRVEVNRPDPSTAILSAREREVAELVAAGHSNDEISQLLHISLRTAEKHVSSALRKLNVRSRLQLGRLLTRSQLGGDGR